MDRRDFVKSSSLAAAGVLGTPILSSKLGEQSTKPTSAPSQELKIKMAVKFGMVQGPKTVLARFELLKKLGFDGVEVGRPAKTPLKELIAASTATGLPIHGVVDSDHWNNRFSDPRPEIRKKAVAALEGAIRDAKTLGASSVLVVPGVVDQSVRYDECYQRSQTEIRKVLPLATELNIKIAFENVWNNFLLSPLEAARYCDEFESPLVGFYFDVGNVIRYGWPEHWIHALGHRIFKLDVKEYSRKKQFDEGPWKGFKVKIGDGDCNWPGVRKALKAIGYSGWATAEVGGSGEERLADIKARMDRALG
ncbi:MAG: sugar phosphate isomerase/epimerase family protein [Planctomycetota bacterium]